MKNKKEFFGVLISVLVCVFLAVLAVYATTTVGDSITIGTDLTVTGNDITFGNAGEIDNPDSELILVTETLFSVDGKASISGDLKIEGNDLTFGNTAALSNAADAELLTLTENLVSIVGKASVSSSLNVDGIATFNGDVVLSGADDDLILTGNDIVFGNGASISNSADPQLLILTETLVSIDGKASVSGNFYAGGTATFAGVASVSDTNGLMVGGGAKMFGGTASPDMNCTAGSLYLQGGGTTFYICAPANTWNQVTLTTL